MNKLFASLLVGTFAFAINTTVFAADAVTKTDASVTTEAGGAAKIAPAKAAQKHHKHAKKMTETAK